MNIRRIVFILTVAILGIASTITPSIPAGADGEYRFVCRLSGGEWTTIAQTPRGDRSFIRWTSNFGGNVGYTREQRCREVSNRLDLYAQTQKSFYLTYGTQARYPIICLTDFEGRECKGLVYTLDPQGIRTPEQTLKGLLELSANDFVASPPVFAYVEPKPFFGKDCRLYINVRLRLQGKPSAKSVCRSR